MNYIQILEVGEAVERSVVEPRQLVVVQQSATQLPTVTDCICCQPIEQVCNKNDAY